MITSYGAYLFFLYQITLHPWLAKVDSSVFEFGWVHYLKKGFSVNNKWKQNDKQSSDETEKANSVDPHETARDEPSHPDVRCLQSLLSGL